MPRRLRDPKVSTRREDLRNDLSNLITDTRIALQSLTGRRRARRWFPTDTLYALGDLRQLAKDLLFWRPGKEI